MKPYNSVSRYSLKQSKNDSAFKNLVFNLIGFLLIFSLLTALAWSANQSSEPLSDLEKYPITLDYANLFIYAIKTSLRMFYALIASFIFSLIYAKLTTLNEYFEQILIPILDVLQSVPILGFITFTVTVFLNLFPGRIIGAELACIFAIFTSQSWNMTYSLIQSLKSIPQDLKDVASIMHMTPLQKFFKLELPYSLPNLIFNVAISISGGWFFVVASEVISVGNTQIKLPGVGSYIALALDEGNLNAIYLAIITIILIILCYDRLFLKPLMIWSEKFQYDLNPNVSKQESFIINLFQRSFVTNKILIILKTLGKTLLYAPPLKCENIKLNINRKIAGKFSIRLKFICIAVLAPVGVFYIASYFKDSINSYDIIDAFKMCSITLIRISVMIIIVSLILLPLGIYIGLRPNAAQKIQPLIQFLAAFPINLLFPVSAVLIHRYELAPNVWLSPLIIVGSQWYILFNVISGCLAFPNDLAEVVKNLNVKGFLWLRKVMLPSIVPYYITGLITAFGGAWNASIVAEAVNYKGMHIEAYGIGSYIAAKSACGDFHRVSLGIIVMSTFVLLMNRLIWRPFYNSSLRKFSFG